MPTYTNVDPVSIAPEYTGELHHQPIIADLTQYECELVTHERMKQHISNHIKESITNAQR